MPDKFNVVYAGNIGVMQDVDVLVSAAKLMQGEDGIQFHIFGDGIYKERLQHDAEGLSNISFWPMQPSELAPSIYAMADVNVIPLAPNIYRTALPSKTATCLACGKPIIFAIGKESKFGEKITKKCDFKVIESGKAEKLADEIKKLRDEKDDNKDESAFFLKYFRVSVNSRRYVELIKGKCE